jgi:hypothetical protein
MAANNETGVISDIAGIQRVLEQTGCKAYWMVDCVQALGKLALNLAATRIDYAPFSGHKLYAPKGIGMLYVRAGAPFTPLIGRRQESASAPAPRTWPASPRWAPCWPRWNGATPSAAMPNWRLPRPSGRCAARSLARHRVQQPVRKLAADHAEFLRAGLASRELMDVFDAAEVRVSSAVPAPRPRPRRAMCWMRCSCCGAAPAPSACRSARWPTTPPLPPPPHRPLWRRAARQLPDPVRTPLLRGRMACCRWAWKARAAGWCSTPPAVAACVIDPLPDHVARIEAFVRCQNYRVQAIVRTPQPGAER